MMRSIRWLAVSIVLLLPACSTLQQIAALRQVEFAFDRITQVSLAGVPLGAGARWTDLRATDAARLIRAVEERQVPLAFFVHVRAQNPADNPVTAQLMELDWTLFIEERRSFQGRLDRSYDLPPGDAIDVPLEVRLDLMELFQGGARDLFDVTLAIAGLGGTPKDLRLELRPTIQTSVGPIRYPSPIVIRRSAG